MNFTLKRDKGDALIRKRVSLATQRSPTRLSPSQSPTSNSDPIPSGRLSQVYMMRNAFLSPYKSRTTNILQQLRAYQDESMAIDFLRKVTPDVSMACWNFIRLANQGHEMQIIDPKSKQRMPRAEAKWNEFAERINALSNAGLDGLIDILHQCAFIRGGMAVEVEVTDDRRDIFEVWPILPQTLHWKLEEVDAGNGKTRWTWIPYQMQYYKGMVRMGPEDCNFFWVPTDPDPDLPTGNLVLAPVLQAIDFQLQILQDLQAVLHHQGWPRNDVSINRETLVMNAPSDVKGNGEKLKKYLDAYWNQIIAALSSIDPDSDYVHYDDVAITMPGGAVGGKGIDVRAVDDLVSVQVCNGLKQQGIVVNRVGGIGETQSWGALTFKIFCDGIATTQRGSKRLMEEIARLCLRVWGIQGKPVFTHNPTNWENEEQKTKVKLMQEQFYAIAQKMNWITGDTAAQQVMGAEKAVGDMPPDAINVSLSMGGENAVSPNDGKGGLHPPKPDQVPEL